MLALLRIFLLYEGAKIETVLRFGGTYLFLGQQYWVGSSLRMLGSRS